MAHPPPLGMETESVRFALYCAAVILRAFFVKEQSSRLSACKSSSVSDGLLRNDKTPVGGDAWKGVHAHVPTVPKKILPYRVTASFRRSSYGLRFSVPFCKSCQKHVACPVRGYWDSHIHPLSLRQRRVMFSPFVTNTNKNPKLPNF
jgi:hypothetical protein